MSTRGAWNRSGILAGARGVVVAVPLVVLSSGCPGDDGNATGDSTTAPPTGTATDPTMAETTNGTTTSTDPTLTTNTTTGPSTVDDSGTGDASDTDNPTTGDTPASCGDGVPDPDEACDDGNGVDSDGCNNDCTISGSISWFHSQASGTGQNDEAFGIAVDAQGRAYVVGEMHNGVDVDHWLRQYEDDGLGWTLVIDGGAADGARAAGLRGNTLYTAGYRAVAGQSNNVWLRSYDLDGSTGFVIEYNDGLNGSNVGQGLAIDPGGNLIVAGNETVDPVAPHQDAWIREHTAAGTPVWTAGYGGAAADQARAVACDGAGNVAAVGFETVGGQTDLWVRVYDTNGAPQWTATHANLDGLDDEAQGVAFDGDGNVIVVGWEIDPVIPWRLWLTKYDPAGVPLWNQTWDGDTAEGARAFGVTVDDTGDIVVVGQHRIAGVNDFLVRKLDPDGNPKWTTNIAGYEGTNQVGRAVAIGPGRRVWVAGGVDQGVDGRDVYVARLAP
ncbi:hypothetical protein [Paraliomyxa miuraensis]|uniref:hypothetical protein n=1 Tax=Paraliomyxa miuraensis TaxID=376150 RepID=UPI0022575371|nr:hypothetical protein [Paraliomyxa miuraensis]MCX4243862.1 hypothetical protein [Paraliomyxa miuraensis]